MAGNENELRPGLTIFPSQVAVKPDDYPDPKPGLVTQLDLTTPDKQAVGTLLYDGKGGLTFTPADQEDMSAQEHSAELLNYIRGNKTEGTPADALIESIRDAYTGDFKESTVRYVPTTKQ
jgi:hypothetical protein